WALGGRDEGRPAGLASDSRTPELTAAPPSSRPADRASRDGRAVPVPALGTLAAGAPTPTTTAPAPTAGPTTRRPSQAPSPSPSSQPTATRRTSSAPAPAPAPATGITAEVTRLTNVERAKAGCGALRIDSRLTTAAQAHSTDMVDRDYFSHTSPDGEGPGDRAAAAGYDRWSGENIAAGYPTAAAVVQGWMNSAGHKANILNCQSKATGVGYDARRNMWTQMFGFE
ncbi:MAG TPA: CAP domain-containing protein, partial [Mycobacteriales bacterium]|nr:CAP domain-containing protein [Mycobacteriales bacterium]